MSAQSDPTPQSRIQRRNRQAIMDAALDAFSQYGLRGTSLEQIAAAAGLSKQNVIYYFGAKDAIYTLLLDDLLETWLDPLQQLGTTDTDPVEEIIGYVLRKLDMSRTMPRESRLFANEIVQGAPQILPSIELRLKPLVDEKAKLIQGWIDAGRIAPVDPHHLFFSIWATTQHYADFDAQVRGILASDGDAHFDQAAEFLATLYRRMLTPGAAYR